jgi:hypothetical protein
VIWEDRAEIPPSVTLKYASHTSNPLAPPSILAINQVHEIHSSGTSWPVGPQGIQGVEDNAQQWSAGHAQSDYGSYPQQGQLEYTAGVSTLAQAPLRPSTRRKVAKVPSSFVERQEKLKVSKRKGPLLDKQREKTHTMRKTKRICVRCRFYKSGVSTSQHLHVQS